MSSYEVLYFDFSGRGEPLRILLHAAGVHFKDTRFQFKEWPDIKPTTPLGFVPVLKVDGKSYCQSLALYRYAAKLAGFYPADPLEALVVDEMLDSMHELMSKAPRGGENEEEKKAARQEFQKTTMTQYADVIEAKIQSQGGGCGFTVSSEPTVADFMVMGLVESVAKGHWDYVDTNFFEAYPGMMKTSEATKAHPKVVSYYESVKKE